MDRQRYLISRLADGNFHSGQALADDLGISRTAVWKRIKTLSELELKVYSVSGKGHRLSQNIELLDAVRIKSSMTANAVNKIDDLKILSVTDSTNQYLNQLLNEKSIHAVIVLAEYQLAGKGRRGTDWISPYASGLCMSLGWHFDTTPVSHTALSLATGVAVCRSLQRLGINNAGLKWPNDIISNGKKLGGILLESRGETAGCSDVIIGIGINVNLPDRTLNSIQQPACDINSIADHAISRNDLSGIIIEELLLMLENYQNHGFSSFIDEWRDFDALLGAQADIVLRGDTLTGEVLGIDENGLLMMSINGETRSFSSGELSLRVRG